MQGREGSNGLQTPIGCGALIIKEVLCAFIQPLALDNIPLAHGFL